MLSAISFRETFGTALLIHLLRSIDLLFKSDVYAVYTAQNSLFTKLLSEHKQPRLHMLCRFHFPQKHLSLFSHSENSSHYSSKKPVHIEPMAFSIPYFFERHTKPYLRHQIALPKNILTLTIWRFIFVI